jgi:hypothetical protein
MPENYLLTFTTDKGEVDVALIWIVSMRDALPTENGNTTIATLDGKVHTVNETLAAVRAKYEQAKASA